MQENGFPLCFMDSTYLTALRTAAGSAIATKLFAKPDSKVLSVFGAGLQVGFYIIKPAIKGPSSYRSAIIRSQHSKGVYSK
jgi:ornithine cyclodeaminase/alanine dehydrogenase-like protein (mu-crystallin family)